MVCKFKGDLVNCHALFLFYVLFKADQYLSVVLNLLQNNSVNHDFFIVFKTSSN